MRPQNALIATIGIAMAGLAWLAPVSDAAAAEGKTGGTLKLLANAAAGTIDPHINYTLQYWQLYHLLYDGLLAFKKAAGETGSMIVPDLAEAMPEVQRRR